MHYSGDMMPLKTEAIKLFLESKSHADLAKLYNHDMEVQVNVSKEGGKKVEGDYKGTKWIGYSDDINTWKPFRIPWNAATEPKYSDTEIGYDIFKFAEGIGMTGWDWKSKLSRWVAYDFDAITGHSERHTKKLTENELMQVRDSVSKLEWVTVRKSTSGSGLHLYVFLDPPVPTQTHTEHAALARSILGQMSAEAKLDLHAKIDACGQNMWVWHRKMAGTDGLTVIKTGVPLTTIPVNWRDHVDVISGRRKRVVSDTIKQAVGDDYDKIFNELTGQRVRSVLDNQHLALIDCLKSMKFTYWWDADHNMLVTHTYALKMAHNQLKLKGLFETLSLGTEDEHNCFCFPMGNGAWAVRRYTPGTAESPTWDQDRNGWTRCYLNKLPDLETLNRMSGALEASKGGYVYSKLETAAKALKTIGIAVDVPTQVQTRQVNVKETKDGKIVLQMDVSTLDRDEEMSGWLKEKKTWTKVLDGADTSKEDTEIGNYDDVVRHLVSETKEDCGWLMKTGSSSDWRAEPINHVTLALGALGLNAGEVKEVEGASVINCWTLVNRPFEPEYPGNRQWNRNAVQFKYPPTLERDALVHPTWTMILDHCGLGLDPYIKENKWCIDNGVTTGGQYLKCWVASVFQKPTIPLPYLFFYSKEQNTGKSTFHEALNLLVTQGAIVRADLALGNTQFNGELAGAVICTIEETDLSKAKSAYNKIKDWVTSSYINIRAMYQQPYSAINTTHWIQCSNEHGACPMFPGDTRITMINVQPLDPQKEIPRVVLYSMLIKEAPDFLASLLSLELPDPNGRLGIPIIATSDKATSEQSNMTLLDAFIAEKCIYCPGAATLFSEVYLKFIETLNHNDEAYWTKIRVGRSLDPNKYPKGRLTTNPQMHVGNLTFDPAIVPTNKLKVVNQMLRPES